MLTQMLTETLLGAMTGYVTNNTAIRSLFKPGGVVEKTRDDFAREAGRLLEDQVLTAEVLQQQLQLPEVQQVIGDALDAFLQQELPQQLQKQKLADLPDWEHTEEFLHQVIREFVQKEREQILVLLKRNLPVSQILTETQCNLLMRQLEQILTDTLQQENPAVQFWRGWKSEHGNDTLAQLGLAPLCGQVLQQAARYSADWPAVLKTQYAGQLQELLQQSVASLQLRPVLLELDQQMENYSLQHYLQCDAATLNSALQQFLQTEQGQELLAYISEEILTAMKQITVPVNQVLPQGFLDQVGPILDKQMPLILAELVDWLRENEQEVWYLLTDAIDEIATETGGMKGMLLNELKQSVLPQILQQTDIGAFLLQFVLNEENSLDTADVLMEQLQDMLSGRSLGELITKMDGNGRLRAAVQLLLTDNLLRALAQSGEELTAKLLEWKPGSFHLIQHQDEMEQWVARILLDNLEKLDLSAILVRQKGVLEQQTVTDLLNPTDEQLEKLLATIIPQACGQLAATLPNLTSDAVYRPLYEGLEHLLQRRGAQWIRNLGEQHTLQQVLQLAGTWLQQQKPELVAFLSAAGIQLTQGRLSQLAENQIQQLSNADMLKLVEDFMGQELQPLNYLGAGMGAVAGATVGTALSAAMPMTQLAGPAMILGILAGKAAVFGTVGYGTNCAAVKGLFWPYEPVGGVDMIQGVIPKQKERFAHSMGQLVDRYVINETILQQGLQQGKTKLVQAGDLLAADAGMNHRLAAEITARRREIAEALLTWAETQADTRCEAVLERLGEMPLAFVRGEQPEGDELENRLLAMAEGWLEQELHSGHAIGSFVSGEQLWNRTSEWVSEQPLPDLVGMVHRILQSSHAIGEFLTESQQQNVLSRVQKVIEEWLAEASHQKTLTEKICTLLQVEKLFDWLKQQGGNWLDQNLSSLFGMIEQAVLRILQEQQARITAGVQQAILNRLGLMQQMGYSMMGGDSIVAQIVDRILHQKLPIFLSLKKQELQEIILRCWRQYLEPEILALPLEQHQLEGVLELLLAQPALHQCAGRIGFRAVNLGLQLPVQQIGQWITVDSLLERVQVQLGFQWQLQAAQTLQNWKPLFLKFYEEHVAPIQIGQLTSGYRESLPLKQLAHYTGLPALLASVWLRLQENISITRPQQWLDWPQLSVQMEHGIRQLLQDSAFRQWSAYESEIVIVQLMDRWEQLLPVSMRCAVLQPVMEAALATAETYGTPLLQAMNLSKLSEVQLAAMDGAHLEQTVRGFASQYLTHIENRGWLGAVFALPGMLLYLL